MSKISRIYTDNLKGALGRHVPEKLYPVDMICSLLATHIHTECMKLMARGYTNEEAEKVVKPKIDLLKKLMKQKEEA